jgi:uncharacterized membrane protein YcaP (DUF421 family)
MALRALIIYVTAILLVRLGEKRFMGKNTAFDVILGIILGSVLSRAVTGNAGFFQTIGAGAMLVGLHWLFSVAAYYSDRFGTAIKGDDRILVEDGEIIWDNMRKSHIGENDLLSALRNNGQVQDLSEVKVARFERNGDISVIKRDREPRVVEIAVRDGVQTVRIELA